MKKSTAPLLSVSMMAVVLAWAHPVQACSPLTPTYIIDSLGCISGGTSCVSKAKAISHNRPGDNGTVTTVTKSDVFITGDSNAPDSSSSLKWHAFRWTNAAGMVDLGTLRPNGMAFDGNSYGAAVNRYGDIVGSSEYSGATSETHAYLYPHNASAMIDLHSGANGLAAQLAAVTSKATAISDQNVIVGEYTVNGSANKHAFRMSYTAGTPVSFAPATQIPTMLADATPWRVTEEMNWSTNQPTGATAVFGKNNANYNAWTYDSTGYTARGVPTSVVDLQPSGYDADFNMMATARSDDPGMNYYHIPCYRTASGAWSCTDINNMPASWSDIEVNWLAFAGSAIAGTGWKRNMGSVFTALVMWRPAASVCPWQVQDLYSIISTNKANWDRLQYGNAVNEAKMFVGQGVTSTAETRAFLMTIDANNTPRWTFDYYP